MIEPLALHQHISTVVGIFVTTAWLLRVVIR